MITKLYTLGCVVFDGAQINQIESVTVNPGLESLFYQSDGAVDPTYVAVMSQRPALQFTTSAIVRALAVSALSCANIASSLDAWFQRYAAGGTRMTGSNSTKFSFAGGMLCPTQITARQGGRATITYALSAVSSNGTTSPLSITTASAMPALLDADQMFTVGPAKINGTTLTGVTSITFDTGIRPVLLGADGEAYDTFVAINDRRPRITIRSKHADFAAESGMGFVIGQSATDSLVWLRKIAEGGTRVANGTAEHVRFSIDDGLITIQEASGEGGGEGGGEGAEIEVIIEPSFDGTNDIVAISTAATIS
jgi:hypothetical protein